MPEDFDIADLSKIKNFGGSSVVYEPCEGYIVKENISVDDSICHDFQTGLENKTTNAIEANLENLEVLEILLHSPSEDMPK